MHDESHYGERLVLVWEGNWGWREECNGDGIWLLDMIDERGGLVMIVQKVRSLLALQALVRLMDTVSRLKHKEIAKFIRQRKERNLSLYHRIPHLFPTTGAHEL